jgi:tetratricopeptide (TPR) repeat protein
VRRLEPGLALRSYRLVRRLGFGGDGEVWVATDPRGVRVALKARPAEGGTQERRFRKEFERLRALRLPNVVRVLDAGTDQGWVFFTMELALGEPFDAWVGKGRSLAERVRRAGAAGAHVARALAGVHRLGLAHRDVKPANVIVDGDGLATLLDFGTARFGPARDTSSEFMGTVAYMAPEQRLGLPHDHRVDCYALGVTLHEALSGVPAAQGRPGRARPSLLRLGPEVPRALADLVDRLMALDPAARPAAEEAEALLLAVAEGRPLPPAPWPEPPTYQGDASWVLEGSMALVGPPGSGRRRTLEEARFHWYRKGYRSIAGRCQPDRPFGAICEVLTELFAVGSPAWRRELAGDDAALLQAVWAELPVPVARAEAWPPDPYALAGAVGRVLQRVAPIAVVLWRADRADLGSAACLSALVRNLPEGVRIWATAEGEVPGLARAAPPPWSRALDARVQADLLPDALRPLGPSGSSPLLSCARAWRGLAAWRGEPGPALRLTQGLGRISVLDEPFPAAVATALSADAHQLVADGHLCAAGEPAGGASLHTSGSGSLRSEKGAALLRFADPGTRRLAQALLEDERGRHAAAARAWAQSAAGADRVLEVASHGIRAGRPCPHQIGAAVLRQVERGNPAEVRRWLRNRDLLCGEEDDFDMAAARLYAALELSPGRVGQDELAALARRAGTPAEQARADWLRLTWEARHGDRAAAVREGRRTAGALSETQPALASAILREVALAELGDGEVEAAVRDCRRALDLAHQAARRGGPSPHSGEEDTTTTQVQPAPPPPAPPGRAPVLQVEVDAATTLSAGLLYSGRLRAAVALCADFAGRCREAGLHRGHGAMLANQAIGEYALGQRDPAGEHLAAARRVQPLHRDPMVLANIAVVQARLAVDRGDRSLGRQALDEAITTGQSQGARRVLAGAWCVALEAAIQAADPDEAGRAIAAYTLDGLESPMDHWPAVHGRWRWLVGDLDGALDALHARRIGHGGAAVRAERARMLLVAGRYDDAAAEATDARAEAEAHDMAELALFDSLVLGAARGSPDAEYTPLVGATQSSRWVHLYLGALHLDAIRRQLRGENVSVVLRQLRSRSADLRHRLYAALAREDAW